MDIRKEAELRVFSLFEKTQKFVQDTLYFCNVIQSNEFYDHDGYFYQQTKKKI